MNEHNAELKQRQGLEAQFDENLKQELLNNPETSEELSEEDLEAVAGGLHGNNYRSKRYFNQYRLMARIGVKAYLAYFGTIPGK